MTDYHHHPFEECDPNPETPGGRWKPSPSPALDIDDDTVDVAARDPGDGETERLDDALRS